MSTIHNPSQFKPEDYRVEAYLDNQRPAYAGESVAEYEAATKAWEAEIVELFGRNENGTPNYDKICRCSHCGNGRVRYIAAVRHIPTGEMVTFGADCVWNLNFPGRDEYMAHKLASAAKTRRENAKIYHKRVKFIEAHPELSEVIAAYEANERVGEFCRNVISKLFRYGSLSDKQVAAVVKVWEGNKEREAARKAREAEEAAEVKGPAPEGRQDVRGTVLGGREDVTDWGTSFKMLVKLENNSKVWVSIPAALLTSTHSEGFHGQGAIELLKGRSISFRATFTVSKDDPHFAFGKRPTVFTAGK